MNMFLGQNEAEPYIFIPKPSPGQLAFDPKKIEVPILEITPPTEPGEPEKVEVVGTRVIREALVPEPEKRGILLPIAVGAMLFTVLGAIAS